MSFSDKSLNLLPQLPHSALDLTLTRPCLVLEVSCMEQVQFMEVLQCLVGAFLEGQP